MTTKSNQSISKRVLMFCGSALVTSTAVLSFSSEAPAKDRPATIHNHSQAQAICPNLCRQFSNVERYPESGWYPHKWTGHWTHTAGSSQNPYAAVCGCGEWRVLDKNGRVINPGNPFPTKDVRQDIPRAAWRRYVNWMGNFVHKGLSPWENDDTMGDTNMQRLNNTEIWEIRLNGFHRVFFTINNTDKTVQIVQVGGHVRQ